MKKNSPPASADYSSAIVPMLFDLITDSKSFIAICKRFRKLFFIALYLSITTPAASQQNIPVLDPDAFDKFVSQEITYAITGENVPTGGIKVDLTKATGTLTGYLYNPKGLDVSIDLGIGVTEGTASIFTSNNKKLHSDFNATVNLIYMPKMSSASIMPAYGDMVRTLRLQFATRLSQNRRDSLLAILFIVRGHDLQAAGPNGNHDFNVNAVIAQEDQQLDTMIINAITRIDQIDNQNFSDTTRLNASQIKLIRGLAKRYFGDTVNTRRIDILYQRLQAFQGRDDFMINDLIQVLAKVKSIDEDRVNYQIKISSKYWTVKRFKWHTFSPFVRRQGFSLFEQTVLERKDTSSITYGVAYRYNYLLQWRKGFLYAKIGGDLFRASNLADFTKIEYVQQDSIIKSGKKYAYSETKGVTYTADPKNKITFDYDFGWRLAAEIYIFFSKKNFIPGVYGKYEQTFSEVLLNDHTTTLEFGTPFNINSPDKTKSIVSIAPYIRLENLNAASNPNVENKIQKDEYTIGIRIGLPISIASRSL